MELVGAVEVFILEGVKDIEARDPGENEGGEQEGECSELGGNGEVGADGSECESEAEY